MARKTILVCDNCGAEVSEGKGAVMRINYVDARRGSRQADLCDSCATKMPGRAAARVGREPVDLLFHALCTRAYEEAPEARTTMDGCPSRWCSGRRMPARSRCSS